MELEEQKWIRKKAKAHEEGNLEQLAYACSKLAELYIKYEHFEEALKEYKEQAVAYEAQGAKIKLAVANRMIGEVLTSMGKYRQALQYQVKHLELAKAEGDMIEEQRALATIGRTYFCQAESLSNESDEYATSLGSANNAYKRSLILCENLKGIGKHEHAQMRARLLLNIGLVQECQNDIEKAVGNIQKAILICKELDLFEDLYRCYSSLGMLYHRQSDSGKALSYLKLALDVASRLDDKVQLSCEILSFQAEVFFSLPDFLRAKQALYKAHKLKTPIDADRKAIEKNLKIAIAMCNVLDSLKNVSDNDYGAKKKLFETMGDGCVAVKNYKTALDYYHRMLQMSEALGETGETLATVYVSLSQTYKDNKEYDKSLDYFRKELEIWKDNPFEACKTTLEMGEVLELRGSCYEELEEIYSSAKNLARKSSNLKLEILALEGLHNAQVMKGYSVLAEETMKELDALKQDVGSESSSEEDEEEDTPDIGNDICLETYTDSDCENEEFDRPNVSRKRPRYLKIRRNEKGETQLHIACMNGSLAQVKKLIEQGHPVNERDHCGWLPIHEASNHGHRDIVEFLLCNGAWINDPGGKQCGGVTPIHDAASCGHLSVIELLLDRGADVSCRTDEGDTPLDCLEKWYSRTDPSFNPIERTFFDEILSRLRRELEKVGQNVDSHPLTHVASSRTSTKSFRKRSNENDNLRRVLIDSDSEDEEEVSKQRTRRVSEAKSSDSSSGSSPPLHDDGVASESSGDAALEYQDVMNMLRTKEKKAKGPVLHKKKSNSKGFLQEEDVGEDWLEEDIFLLASHPKKKKRQESNLEKHFSEFASEIGKKTVCSKTNYVLENSNEITNVDSLSMSQSSVIACPQNNERPVDSETSVGTAETSLVKSVRVLVGGKLLLVPVEQCDTIGLLAEKAAKRYFQIEGIQPTLKLVTKDGALLSEDDPVSLIFSEEIVANVTSWNIPLLTDRYKDACKLHDVECDKDISLCLEESEAKQSLNLCDLALKTSQLAPVFRAISHQHKLKHLLLSGNRLDDGGLQLLTVVLPTLTELQELDLSCNDISADGIKQLSTALNSSDPILQELSHLDLSFNRLGNACIKHLAVVLKKIPSVSVLKLQNCQFDSNVLLSVNWDVLNLSSISELDISFNKLNGVTLSTILNQLSPDKIESIMLQAMATSTGNSETSAVQAVIDFIDQREVLHKLKKLDLSNCNVTDDEVQELLRVLRKCNSIRSLFLCNNKNLSSVSLRRLLQCQLPLHTLDLAGCMNTDSYLESTSLIGWIPQKGQLRLENLTINLKKEFQAVLVDLWKAAWGSRAVIRETSSGLVYLSVTKSNSTVSYKIRE